MIVDLFAGGGGASLGIRMGLGRDPDVAVNHDIDAVAMHAANHPGTRHLTQDVWNVKPLEVTGGEPVELLWASPDCKHFSKAKGGKPVNQRIRDLAWVVIRWARDARPAVIMLENVEEFRTWGPLGPDGRPDKARAGEIFDRWVGRLRDLGYRVEWRELRACDYGAPTIRKRLFMIARRDGKPIIWPDATHGPEGSGLLPYRTAAECIDWSIPCPSIFERKRPLAENTLKRIAKGLQKFVIEAAEPFIVTYYGPKREGDFRGQGLDEPLKTQTAENRHALVMPFTAPLTHQGDLRVHDLRNPMNTITAAHRGEHALIAPTLVQTGYGERPGRWRCANCGFTYDLSDLPTCGCVKCGSEGDPVLIPGQAPRVPGLDKPLGTVVAGGVKHALVSTFLTKHFGTTTGQEAGQPLSTLTGKAKHGLCAAHLIRHFSNSVGQTPDAPAPTTTAGFGGKSGLVTSNLVKLYGTSTGSDHREPMHTITAGGQHIGEVRAFLTKYYGMGTGQSLNDPAATLTARDRLGLVTVMVQGEPYVIADIGMRMLQPRELFRAQGFPDSYVIDNLWPGRRLTKTAQVRMCGNSVCPPVAAALVRANLVDIEYEAAA